jgi:hypothetical protein
MNMEASKLECKEGRQEERKSKQNKEGMKGS